MNKINNSDIIEYAQIPEIQDINLEGSQAILFHSLVHLLKSMSINKDQTASICTELHRLFAVDPFFCEVDRVSIVTRAGLSNNLWIKDFSQSSRCHLPDMVLGYSCFVSPKSSLFKLNKDQIRIFGNSNHIIDNFKLQNKEPQKSIQLLSVAGLKSGVCLPIFQWGILSGFIFLNSIRSNYFSDLSQEDAYLLQFVSGLARTWLSERMSEPVGYTEFLKHVKAQKISAPFFNIESLKILLEKTFIYYGLQKLEWSISGAHANKKTMWVDYNFAFIAALIVMSLNIYDKTSVGIHCELQQDQWLSFKFIFEKQIPKEVLLRRMTILQNMFRFLDADVKILNDKSINIRVSTDQSYFESESGPYSVWMK